MSELLPIRLPRVAMLQGDWLLCLHAGTAQATALHDAMRTALPPWVAVVQRGGCPAADLGFGEAWLVERALDADADDEAVLAFSAAALDLRALQILRSALLAQLAPALGVADAEADEEVMAGELAARLDGSSIVLLPAQSHGADFASLAGASSDASASEYDMYPAPRTGSFFSLTWTQQPGTLRRCVVTFAMPVDDELLQGLARHIAPWVRLLELGGFEQPSDTPGLGRSRFGGVQIFEEDSAEIVVDSFEAAEGAWCVLSNLLVVFAWSRPIVSVEVC